MLLILLSTLSSKDYYAYFADRNTKADRLKDGLKAMQRLSGGFRNYVVYKSHTFL